MGSVDRVIRRRILLGVLVFVSLGLLTVWYREVPNGQLHGAQGRFSDVVSPVESAAQRVAQPFRDAAAWTRAVSLRSDQHRLDQEQIRTLERQLALKSQGTQNSGVAAAEQVAIDSAALKPILADHSALRAAVVARPANAFDGHTVTIDKGKADGVADCQPVLGAYASTSLGPQAALAGKVLSASAHTARVMLLDDPEFGVAVKVATTSGTLSATSSSGGTLGIDGIPVEKRVDRGLTVSTLGSFDTFTTCYPAGIPIGVVQIADQTGAAVNKTIQVGPFLSLDDLTNVYVLTPKVKAQ